MLSRPTAMSVMSALVSLPLLMGQGCPGVETSPGTVVAPAQSIALLDVTLAAISATALPTEVNFNPGAAGKLITMTIRSNATGSRPEVRIIDNLENLVAQQMAPTTAQTTVTFNSTTTGSHRVLLRERGAQGSLYDVLVVQQP